jgi:hypothetical protein
MADGQFLPLGGYISFVGYYSGNAQLVRIGGEWQTGSIPRCTSLCCITASMSGQFPSGGGLARPDGRASKHDQMFIELNSLDLNVSTSSEVEAGETANHA